MVHAIEQLKVGVLALQGDFEMHRRQIALLGAEPHLVKLPDHLTDLDALIIPGGESTTMDKLMDRFALRKPLLEFGARKPIWGTCAGMIMLSSEVIDNQAGIKPLALMDMSVLRNGYGRQVFSFEEKVTADLDGTATELTATFIRAPRLTRLGDRLTPLAEYAGSPVLVASERHLASSFHSELDDDTRLLEFFLTHFALKSGSQSV
ncbi:MAG TPA: pyridoxal 5'-phosphate synthase glutaminase subunit PdxT [candidate division Zixibacteria bacterium]|nr:pyridoxal 5'-phosphate synthase glutaminase subunit PdxT [candidate division Zixibacteria bacterium]